MTDARYTTTELAASLLVIGRLEQERGAAQDLANEMADRATELQAERDIYADENRKLRKDNDDKDVLISDLRDEVDHWRDQASSLAAERDSLKEENSGLQASLSAAMQCIDAATSEVVRLERKQKRSKKVA